jgi:hypothetical protein
MKHYQTIFLFLFFISFHDVAFSQTSTKEVTTKRTDIGLSVQFYPAGIIATANAELFFNRKSSMFFRLGGNFANRKDYSPYNDNEKGNGFGGTIGYRYHFNLKKGNIIVGLNTDVWNMWINWKDNIAEPNQIEGQTYTMVLQPWLEAGYFVNIKKSPLQVGLTTGFGREINVITNGEVVGQGWMNSVLFYFQYTIN